MTVAVDTPRRQLLDWVARRFPGERVEIVETHISLVAFVADRVFKRKKPVHFPFVDLSTAAARERDCEREIALNRRLAPDVYVGVTALTDDEGRVVDHLVEMRRMPAGARLSTLAAAGADVDRCVGTLAAQVAELHASSPRAPQIDAAASHANVCSLWEQAFAQTSEFEGPVLDAGVAACTAALARRYLAGRRPLFDARVAAGRARDGHGDLLAEDIFCLPDGPRVLDCLEFDDRLRYGDVLADVAFLAMDLETLGRADLARRFLEGYASAAHDAWPRSLEHFYVAYRAHVRAKVACLRHAQGHEEARSRAERLLEVSHRHLEAARVRLVLVGGAPATGKTTVAVALANETGWPVLRSDAIRAERAGTRPDERIVAPLDADVYTSEAKSAVYDALLARASRLLEQGESVILDASWSESGWRAAAQAAADATASDVVALRCTVAADVAAARAAARAEHGDDLSGAGPEVARALAARFAPWPEALTIDTSRPVATAADDALRAVSARRCAAR